MFRQQHLNLGALAKFLTNIDWAPKFRWPKIDFNIKMRLFKWRHLNLGGESQNLFNFKRHFAEEYQ